jgi:peptidoglycan/xylan/chitin deacetylase (PgdA/CDA1 family)
MVGNFSGTTFPFDIFEAVRFWLTDEANANAPSSAYDEHERLQPAASAQEILGVREIPVVNAYFVLLRSSIESRLGIRSRRPLPEGKECVIVLSHDVENPISPFDPSQNFRLAGVALTNGKPGRAASHILQGCRGLRGIDGNSAQQYWQFDNITKSEDRHGFRSTFFFSSISNADGADLDLNYDVRAPRFRRLAEKLSSGGWEVGLHLSYNARKGAQRMKAERERLEDVTQRPVRGTRHHYWHLSRPIWQTLEDHGKAGIVYDTSIAFNEQPGYRLGIGYPFRPWDPRMQRPVSAVQIPTLFMDGAFFYHGTQSIDSVMARVAGLIDCLKSNNGVAVIDWHDYTSYPVSNQFALWGEAYIEILRLLASDHAVAVLSCEQLMHALHLH